MLTMCTSCVQGRGQHTYAYTHALETGHHMFMKLADGRVYCLPEGYEVEDRSLDTIRYVLNPTFTPAQAWADTCLHSLAQHLWWLLMPHAIGPLRLACAQRGAR